MHSSKVVKTTVTEKMTVLFGTTFTQTTIFHLTYKAHYCYVHSLTVLSTKLLALTFPILCCDLQLCRTSFTGNTLEVFKKFSNRKKRKFTIKIIDWLVYKNRIKYQFNASSICKSVQKSCFEKLSFA